MNLHLDQGVAIADTKVVELKEDPNGWYEFKSEQTIAPSDLDAVLMRKDPFDTDTSRNLHSWARWRERCTDRQQTTKPTWL